WREGNGRGNWSCLFSTGSFISPSCCKRAATHIGILGDFQAGTAGLSAYSYRSAIFVLCPPDPLGCEFAHRGSGGGAVLHIVKIRPSHAIIQRRDDRSVVKPENICMEFELGGRA
ncbi:unnamed protein product, partial [Scytosiphon promiscuus]